MNTVLFLCSGNYYRSRFAEIFFNWHAGQRGLSWKAESRGLAIDKFNPGPMSSHTTSWLQNCGITYDAYLRFPLDAAPADFAAAHHIVAVKQTEHWQMIERRFPAWLERVEFWEVDDLDCVGPEIALPQLEREVGRLLDRLAASDVRQS
jgi:protein-tyrosine phosphatase